jgi:hypothetical protein
MSFRMTGAMMSRLLLKLMHRFRYFLSAATCQSGYGAVCKTVYPGSIPGVASIEGKPALATFCMRRATDPLCWASPILNVKSRQQYLLFSAQLYQIRHI